MLKHNYSLRLIHPSSLQVILFSESKLSPRSFSKNLYKFSDGAVVSPLKSWWEETAGKLTMGMVVGNAVAAFPLSFTGLIGAGAFCFIDFNLALHWNPLLLKGSVLLYLWIVQPAALELGRLLHHWADVLTRS